MSTTKTPLSEIIAVSELAWQERQPGVRMKSIWEHPASQRRAVMTRLEPGVQLPRHRHVGEPGARQCRLDDGRPEALVAQVALEGDVPLEETDCLAELTPRHMRLAEKGRGDHFAGAIVENSRETQRLLAESDGAVVVASIQALDHHERGDPPEPELIAELPGQHLRLVEVFPHARRFADWAECVPDVDVQVDGQLGRRSGLGEPAKGPERPLQMSNGFAIGSPGHGPEPDLAKIGDGLFPQLAAQGVVGQPLGLLGHALGRELLDGLGDAGVQGALPLVEQPLVGHLVGERVLERVLEIREESDLIEELRRLEARELRAHLGLRRVGDGQEQGHGHVLADDGGGLE